MPTLLRVLLVCIAFVLSLTATAAAAPTARYTYSPTSVKVSVPETFDAATSSCDRAPCTYSWKENNSGITLGTGVKLVYSFKTVGWKRVVLTVTNSIAQKSTASKTFNVTAAPAPTPTPSPTPTPTPSPTPTPTPSPTPTPTPSPTPTPTATPTPTPPPTETCAVSTPNRPDGPDGLGGCFPGPSNTGPTGPLTTYTGSCTITAPNTVIDSKVVNCSPLVVGSTATGLLIKNSQVNGGVIQNSGSASFAIEDSLIDNNVSYPACGDGSCAAGQYACGDPNNQTTQCGVGYKNFTITRTEIMHTNRAAYCQDNCTITDSYFHGTNLWPDRTNLAHASSVRQEHYLTLRHSSIGCDFPGIATNGELGCSADLSGYPDFTPIHDNTIDGNLFLANTTGQAYCAYGGGTGGKPYSGDPTNATYQKFTNNVFQKGSRFCGEWGAITDFITGRTGNVWSNNRWDSGELVPAG